MLVTYHILLVVSVRQLMETPFRTSTGCEESMTILFSAPTLHQTEYKTLISVLSISNSLDSES